MAEDERDVSPAELPGQLASLREQLQREARRSPGDELDRRPAVIALARLLAEPVRLRPGGRLRFRLREPAEDRLRRLRR